MGRHSQTQRVHHHLTIHDRGKGTFFRWRPECSCEGWTGVPRRSKRRASNEHAEHVNSVTPHHRSRPLTPRQLTPFDQLPDEFRT